MNWLIQLFTSSIGKKLIMSLTGLFMISFLVVHLVGNLQLMKSDGGQAFNDYAYFMTHFTPIKLISYGLYFLIILHSIQGILIYFTNRKAKGNNYKVKPKGNRSSWASANMTILGTLILAFIFIHMGDFWFKMKFTDQLTVAGTDVRDLYTRVATAFKVPWIVVVYVIGQLVLAFHLWHGFASAFQTLGLNHAKYTPIIEFVGKAFAILIPAGFALIPIYHFFMM